MAQVEVAVEVVAEAEVEVEVEVEADVRLRQQVGGEEEIEEGARRRAVGSSGPPRAFQRVHRVALAVAVRAKGKGDDGK